MVHKANVVCMISIILLLLFSSKLVFYKVSENPKHGSYSLSFSVSENSKHDVAKKIISRSHLHIVRKIPVPRPYNHGPVPTHRTKN
ncbi:hypothetical protein D8674_002858 [Pyrus ussuriensis x Pyrus communis]|uniref:Transmembrane protein n=1 Tax=Pyrus ussuriensis x Pyrus communis TaxID=2448454 RepID=A0A5N5FG66_9ROSA|nr:hypothetical protein D8674_002858 [Pyrus ussuriensis x Pyrus communis]